MDEKTEELRDIFMSVSDDETVTERQNETRGSLVAVAESADPEAVRDVVEELRDQYPFETDLSTDDYVDLVRAFYGEGGSRGSDDADGRDAPVDEAIADELGLLPESVFAARLDLHLLRDADTDAPFDLSVLRQRREDDADAVAADLDVDVETVRHYRRVVASEDEARASNYRYRREFDELLDDAALSDRLTESMQDDGLRDAAEDIETDVSF